MAEPAADGDPSRSTRVTFHLAAQASRGEAGAWEQLYARLFHWLLRQLAGERRPKTVAPEEIVDAAFVGLFRQIEDLATKPRTSVRGLLLTIARARQRDACRRERAARRNIDRTVQFGEGGPAERAEDLANPAARTPSSHARAGEMAAQLDVALAKLRQKDQQLVRLVLLEERPRDEVRELLAISTDVAFRSRLHHALKRLRAHIDDLQGG